VAPARENKLQSTVKRVFRGEGVPPFEHHARELCARALDPNGAAADLTRIVLQDVGLTSQILRVANSPLYNRSGRAILSVAHGITLLGWDTVRDLVSAMKYVEHFARRSPGVRELMLLALLSASHARGVALRLDYPRAEEAYVAGLFRNLGEILVACYCPSDYCEIVLTARRHNIGHESACLRVLGFSWDDLAARAGELWDLPYEVRMCLGDAEGQAKSPALRSLASIVNYGHDLTHVLYRKGATLDRIHLRTVLDLSGRERLVTVAELRKLVDAAIESAGDTMRALRIPIDALKLEQQARAAQAILDDFGREAAEDVPIEQADMDAVEQELEHSDFDATRLISALLKALCRAGFDRALLALLSENRTWMRARLCEGVGAQDALAAFKFSATRPDGPLAAAIARQQDVFADCERDQRYNDSALVRALNPRRFALYPVVVEGVTVGCIYADAAAGATRAERECAALSRAVALTARVITRLKEACGPARS
jgi:HD-like signal output (HDOD) protein